MRCLTIDLGTSFAKLAVCSTVGDQLHLEHSLRLPSGIGAYDGSAASVARFLRLCEDLQAAVDDCLTRYAVDRIGLTGIREGLVLLDEALEPLWVSGNAVLDGPHLLDLPIGDIAIGPMLPDLLAPHPNACAGVTLQGYLAHRLGGRLAITVSELDAWGALNAEGETLAAVERLLRNVPTVEVGASLGPHRGHSPDLYLAGTDEAASHYGAGVGVSADLGLATATFWSLTAPTVTNPPRYTEVRYIPQAGPYCAAASIIGYRWGPYLQEALSGQRPILPDKLPCWAVGELLSYLRQSETPDREGLITAAVTDLRDAFGLLAQMGNIPSAPTIVVHGGGLTGLRTFTTEVMQRLGHKWIELPGDATQLGCYLAGLV
ncbi:MAG: hypothetical protein ABFD96_20580 [Armatimonadia bacterium]